jgi:hypothetical protein
MNLLLRGQRLDKRKVVSGIKKVEKGMWPNKKDKYSPVKKLEGFFSGQRGFFF